MVTQDQTVTVNIQDKVIFTLIYAIIVFMSYLMMFILMSYNFGIIITVIIGNAVGYLIFFNTKRIITEKNNK